MSVYQSKTLPEIRRRRAEQILDPYVIEVLQRSAKERKLFLRDLKKHLGVPARVTHEERTTDFGVVLRWDWFEVETT